MLLADTIKVLERERERINDKKSGEKRKKMRKGEMGIK